MGERLTLLKSILEVIPMFWHSMLYIPKGVLEKIRKTRFKFLWSRKNEKRENSISQMEDYSPTKGKGRVGFE
jgi:hypothetical protein